MDRADGEERSAFIRFCEELGIDVPLHNLERIGGGNMNTQLLVSLLPLCYDGKFYTAGH
jgi:hypothetical protein